MVYFYYRYIKNRRGLGTIEIIIIIAILIGIALLFKGQIVRFVTDILASIFSTENITNVTTAPTMTPGPTQ